MRHRVKGKKLRRSTAHRRALLRNLVTSLLERERVRTTLAKAKATRPLAEKMITLAKKDTLHTRRLALRFIFKKDIVKKLFEELGPRFSERPERVYENSEDRSPSRRWSGDGHDRTCRLRV